jgi:hypothetical protein
MPEMPKIIGLHHGGMRAGDQRARSEEEVKLLRSQF